jgi:NADH-quinone oxidoreductase subunit M
MLSSWLLTLTWLLPLFSAGALMAFPSEARVLVRRFTLGVNALNLGIILWLSFQFMLHPPTLVTGATETALAFASDSIWFPALHVHYHVGVDAISMAMMFLASVVVFSATLASWNLATRVREFFILLQILAAGVFGSFISFDLFTFFVFNELTLIPTYLLVGIFGTGRKEYAAMKLNLLLMGGSALILLGILGLYFESGIHSFSILELSQIRFDHGFQAWAFPVLFLGFAILGNMFPFHIWSPDGHAAAPTAVSMFLAGVHMKLGGYGCLRVAIYLLPEGAHMWMDFFVILVTVGVVWGAVVAIKQKDLKYMNAYSSVSHCGLVFLGLATLNLVGLRGAVLQMLAHGFITSAVFCLIGLIYARTHTRLIPEMSGLMARMPFLAVCFSIAGLAALGLPGLAGFAAEINIFLGGFATARPLMLACSVLAVLSIVVTAIYVLRATNSILHGPALVVSQDLSDATFLEKIPLLLLLACIAIMGLFPGPLVAVIDQALLPILSQLNR